MNWGWKITSVYVLFALGMIGLVLMASSQRVDLVSKDYYKEELAFSQQMDAAKHASSLNQSIQVDAQEGILRLSFPDTIQTGTKIQLHWYCPFNALHDRKVECSVEDSHVFLWDVSETPSGNYELRAQWQMGDHNYYQPIQVKR